MVNDPELEAPNGALYSGVSIIWCHIPPKGHTRFKTWCFICNELGEASAGWTPARPASVDQVHTKNNRHTPVMVYDDLMINKHSVMD